MLFFAKHIVVFALIVSSCKIVGGDEIVFLKGDASFVGIVDADSDFTAKNGSVVRAATGFAEPRGSWMDSPRGLQLDVSTVPPLQLSSARRVVAELIQADPLKRPVLLCFTSDLFDFERYWLGVPYNNTTRYRLGPKDNAVNRFGPPGSPTLSVRDARLITPLPVEVVGNEECIVTGAVCICVISMENAILQRARHVIYPDGERKQIDFNYSPEYRVCFDDGDAFFLADAQPFTTSNGGDVDLDYCVLPRRGHYNFHPLGEETSFSEDEVKTITSELPLLKKGQVLRVKNVEAATLVELRRQMNDVGSSSAGKTQTSPNHLKSWEQSERKWFVFVFEKNYDVAKHRVSKRYNLDPIVPFTRLSQLEFVDCTFGIESFPTGTESDPWPSRLPVEWRGEMAEVELAQTKMVFVPHFEGVCFSDDADQFVGFHYELVNKEITKWSNGNRVNE